LPEAVVFTRATQPPDFQADIQTGMLDFEHPGFVKPVSFSHFHGTPPSSPTQTKQVFKEIHCVSTLYAPDFRQNHLPGTKRPSLTSENIDKNSII